MKVTGRDLVSLIQACKMEDCEIEVNKGNVAMTLIGVEIGGDKIVFEIDER